MPAEPGQSEIDTSVSLDEFKRLKRKRKKVTLHISLLKMMYCSKNSQIPNEKEDIKSLQVNKDGCREFISGHGEMSVMRVA